MTYSPADLVKIITIITERCDRPLAALRVWSVLQLEGHAEVIYDRKQLAANAGTSVGSVSRAISELETMGALQRFTPPSSRGVRQIAVRLKRFW